MIEVFVITLCDGVWGRPLRPFFSIDLYVGIEKKLYPLPNHSILDSPKRSGPLPQGGDRLGSRGTGFSVFMVLFVDSPGGLGIHASSIEHPVSSIEYLKSSYSVGGSKADNARQILTQNQSMNIVRSFIG